MSVTTTDNAAVVASRHYLADYDLHHGQPSSPAPAPAPSPHPVDSPVTNPPGWEDQWRRVPAYRPVQYQVDEQRNTYNNAVEQNFVRVMFGGVFLISSVSKIWRATGGRVNSDYFKYKVGGEW